MTFYYFQIKNQSNDELGSTDYTEDPGYISTMNFDNCPVQIQSTVYNLIKFDHFLIENQSNNEPGSSKLNLNECS